MSKQKPKYYVVWQGRKPGIYLTWDECKEQVHGAEGARYKSFPTMEEAQRAFEDGAPPI
ncbi:MAG: RNase H1/viroplasmin domain-containing protein, partial [Bacteroidales bacterium]|nr:RNase H1/viroplasmin domain-containing protein [Bacteroidales bacterium]